MIQSLARSLTKVLPAAALLLLAAPAADPRSAACASGIDFACSVRCKAELGSAFLDAGEIWVFADCTSHPNGAVDCIYRRTPSARVPW